MGPGAGSEVWGVSVTLYDDRGRRSFSLGRNHKQPEFFQVHTCTCTYNMNVEEEMSMYNSSFFFMRAVLGAYLCPAFFVMYMYYIFMLIEEILPSSSPHPTTS